MADPRAMAHQANEFFQRNNPIELIIFQFKSAIYNLKTLKSRRKLMKYRTMLELEKYEQMQQLMGKETPFNPQGVKIDRPY